ncbi:MAG: hypothetical protein ACK5N0_12930 [Synechococcaceae cyanobacterium]
MTVLQIRPAEHGCEVIFAESARFYQLRADYPNFEPMLSLLEQSLGRVVLVRVRQPHGEVIEAISSLR